MDKWQIDFSWVVNLVVKCLTGSTEWELQQGKFNLEIIVKTTNPWSIYHV